MEPQADAATDACGGDRVDRAYSAHQLRLAGLDWTAVAERAGYRSGKVAAMSVTTYLQKAAVEQSTANRNAALQLELARLDRLQAAYFEPATAGDIAAANLVLKVIARRSTLLGLDKPEDTVEVPRTIVIGGSTEEYVAGLQAIANGTHPGLVGG